jgi:hypothetical protein
MGETSRQTQHCCCFALSSSIGIELIPLGGKCTTVRASRLEPGIGAQFPGHYDGAFITIVPHWASTAKLASDSSGPVGRDDASLNTISRPQCDGTWRSCFGASPNITVTSRSNRTICTRVSYPAATARNSWAELSAGYATINGFEARRPSRNS